jgi:DNA-binding GntR family transcriptional regulator
MPSTVELAEQALIAEIRSGHLVPGAPILEVEVSSRLSVARSTLREALVRLEVRGLAVRGRARHLTVRRLTRKDVVDLYRIRELLEGWAAKSCAQRYGEAPEAIRQQWAQEAAVWAAAAKPKTTRSNPPVKAFSEDNRRLHQMIIEQSGNLHLAELLERTLMVIFNAQFRGWLSTTELPEATRDHRALLQAIMTRKAALAERVMRHHIRGSGEMILSLPDEAFAKDIS